MRLTNNNNNTKEINYPKVVAIGVAGTAISLAVAKSLSKTFMDSAHILNCVEPSNSIAIHTLSHLQENMLQAGAMVCAATGAAHGVNFLFNNAVRGFPTLLNTMTRGSAYMVAGVGISSLVLMGGKGIEKLIQSQDIHEHTAYSENGAHEDISLAKPSDKPPAHIATMP